MTDVITTNLDLWTSSYIKKSTAGRGSSGKQEAYGITKLRELILDLAVRGKLVPQDSDGEPASVLLEKIAGERVRLHEDDKIRKPKKFPQITDDDTPFELPNGWKWARISDVGHDWGQKTPEDDFTYFDVSAIDNVSGVIKSPSILSASDAPSRARKIVNVGTVIYSTVRPYLKNICVIEEEYIPEPIASTAFAILHPFQEMPGRFFALYLRSPEFVKYVESVQTGIAYPAINDKQFYGGVVPLPPLEEQHRIVAKVDELMALCDQLEQQQTDSLKAHQTLVESLLGTLTSVESQEELTGAWNRIANHFDTLFTTEQSIDQLKQTILQLAVMGKIVPQNPNDEPASLLLKKIDKEKARLITEGKIKKQKSLPDITKDEMFFELPSGWAWARPDGFSHTITDGEHFRPPTQDEGVYFLSAKDIRSEGVSLDDPLYISEETAEKALQRCNPEKGDILIVSRGATVGRMCTVDIEDVFCLLGSVILIKPVKPMLSGYLKVVMKTPQAFEQLVSASGSTAQPAIYLRDIKKIVFPIAPLEEQHRIVAKVDELMALCDTLKARISEAQTTQVNLADAIVEKAVA